LFVIVFRNADSYSYQITCPLRLYNKCFSSMSRHALNRRKELPLVWIRAEVGVNEYAIVLLTRHPL